MNARQKRMFEDARKRNPNIKMPTEGAVTELTDEDLNRIKQGVGDKSPRFGSGEGKSDAGDGEPAPPPAGTIVKYFPEKGFGFIRPDDGSRDVFFHVTRLAEGAPEDLVPNRRVQYDVDYDRTGKMQATNLRVVAAEAT